MLLTNLALGSLHCAENTSMQVGQLGTKLCVDVLVSRFWVNLSKIGGTSRRIFIDVDPHKVLFKIPWPTTIQEKDSYGEKTTLLLDSGNNLLPMLLQVPFIRRKGLFDSFVQSIGFPLHMLSMIGMVEAY